MPPGTRIEVSHLFNSVPGRRKFLKTEVTESTHLIHMAKLYALAHPEITFSLIEGGRTIFRSPACEHMLDRVREIFGRKLSESLSPFKAKGNELIMTGLLGKPGQSRSTRKEMIFFVNRRPVDSKTLSYAVIEAFHTFVPKGRFPPAILFIEIEPVAVDVNVHPSKREIRFRNDAHVRSFILSHVLEYNKSVASPVNELSSPTPKVEYERENGKLVPKMDEQALEVFGWKQTTVSSNPPLSQGKKICLESTEDSQADELGLEKTANLSIKPIIESKLVGERKDLGAEWKFLDLAHGDLALFSTPQGLVAMHIRAAYERVRFEQLEDSLRNSKTASSQSLLLPEPLEFDGIDTSNLQVSLQKLRKLGFVLEEFGRNFYRLEGCPHWVEPAQAVVYLKDFLEIARENEGDLQVESFVRQAMERQANYSHETKGGFSDSEVIELTEKIIEMS